MKRFALIGAAGYIAPRHMKAIKETGNDLVAILDPSDSVGVIDSYFPNSDYFREFERFDRHLEKLRREGRGVDYVSICSPNYLHDSHIRFGLRHQADVICEKPLVLNPWNVGALQEIEQETGRTIYTILQLRLHPAIRELKRMAEASGDRKYDIQINYITARGCWYLYSWKGDIQKSGGVATNIGIHFFDMMTWIFGCPVKNEVIQNEPTKCRGILHLDRATVSWFLSLDSHDLPDEAKNQNKRTYRSIKIGEDELEFSEGFTDLHTKSYADILSGGGFGLDDAKQSIDVIYGIRNGGKS
ncbi:MAG: Gfo/Idh/MocA family oxidoreductase [Kiritimatiellae bacterium]|nr:Gfo/Idh/MocA family oxidoreductase [Kiritimatiellia bacterium]MDD4735947.1 Gfo/Idh/MocA family oxidoreductase [Kiritimatiellia bacterium]